MTEDFKAPKILRLWPLLTIAQILLLTGCKNADEASIDLGRPVHLTTVRYEPSTINRTFVGVIKPRIETDLAFRVAGKVIKRHVKVGDVVAKGQSLAELDPTDLRLQLEQAEAEQRAGLGSLEQAVAAELRAKGLRGGGWSTDAQIEQTRAATEEARARVLRAQRSVDLAKNSLAYATLVADAPGVVTSTSIEPGQVIANGQNAVRIAPTNEPEVVVSLPEILVSKARNASTTMSLWANPSKHYTTVLRELSPTADPVTRTFLARYTIPDADENVLLGMTANLMLSESNTDRIARVPLSALLNQGAGPSVYVLNEGSSTLSLTSVKVRSYNSSTVEISDGVVNGARIVSLGVQKLDPSQKVKIVSSLDF